MNSTLRFAILSISFGLLLAPMPAFAQSGGRGGSPSVTFKPNWQKSLSGARSMASRSHAPILVVFSKSKGRAKSDQMSFSLSARDSTTPAGETLSNMAFVRVTVARNQLTEARALRKSDNEGKLQQQTETVRALVTYGINKTPIGIVTDEHGNKLFAQAMNKLNKTREILAMADKARHEADKLARRISADLVAGEQALARGEEDKARTIFEKVAAYQGFEQVEKAKGYLADLSG